MYNINISSSASKIDVVENYMGVGGILLKNNQVFTNNEGIAEYMENVIKKMKIEYIRYSVLEEMYNLIMDVMTKGYGVELKSNSLKDDDVFIKLYALRNNIGVANKILKDKRLNKKEKRENSFKNFSAHYLFESNREYILDEVSKGKKFYIVTSIKNNFGLGDVDILTDISKYNLKEHVIKEIEEEIPFSFTHREYINLYEEFTGRAFKYSEGGNLSELMSDLNKKYHSLDDIEMYNEKRYSFGGLIGTILKRLKLMNPSKFEKISRDRELYLYDTSKIVEIKDDIEGTDNTDNTDDYVGESVKEDNEDVFGIKESIEKLSSKKDDNADSFDGKESMEGIDSKSDNDVERKDLDSINFRAVDNLHSILYSIGGRRPSKELYSILKKGGVKERVIINFINCKNIGYYDYLIIEDIVKEYVENKG